MFDNDIYGIFYSLSLVIFLLALFIVPIGVTVLEGIYLVAALTSDREKSKNLRRSFLAVDLVAITLAVLLELTYLSLCDVVFTAGWQTQLYNEQRHSPIYAESLPTVIAVLIIGLVGFCILGVINVNKIPPLIPVLAMSMMYTGLIFSVVFTFHVMDLKARGILDLYLLLPPINFILMGIRIVGSVIREYEPSPERLERIQGSSLLCSIEKTLKDARLWPAAALLCMLPLLGVLVCILMIFGQSPDAAIKAFTETADFRLSAMTPPQNIYYDEHYLCTVAAGGDRRIVKPLRMGVRHGHPVIVNRQLCVANAFEQLMEEHTPGLHKAVRSIYDRYGFPVARLIRSKIAADIVYFMMKPLEWIFLIVLYASDVYPEDRIAAQYTGKSIEEIRHGV